MKNLKIKMLLLMSVILVLMLSGICYAKTSLFCSLGKHKWITKQEHQRYFLKTWQECEYCRTPNGRPTYDRTHSSSMSDISVDSKQHQRIWTCKQSDYTENGPKEDHAWRLCGC